MHAGYFANRLSTCTIAGAEPTVFAAAHHHHIDSLLALSRSLVVVPLVTAAALKRMCAPDAEAQLDTVLLEWWLALTLKCEGRVKEVMPILCGEVGMNDGHASAPLNHDSG